MRAIKFRQPIRNKDRSFLEWFYWGYVDYSWVSPALSHSIDTRTDSQQFTGLLDKNGKEIYEGDVVEWISTGGWVTQGKHRDYVIYRDAQAKFDVYSFIIPFQGDLLEVIGNIYENPELCKGVAE